MTPSELVARIRSLVEEKKGQDILVLDLQELTSVTDYFVLVTGSSVPHLKAMSDDIQAALKKEGTHCFRRSGNAESGWMLLDYIDVVVHIFAQTQRDYYRIEELWKLAPRVN